MEETSEPEGRYGLDVNAVVSYNLKAIRERQGWTQQEVADRLAQLTGHTLPQASISAMERGFDGERRRRFDAHELYLLSVLFDVPIVYFFVPPPGSERAQLADTGRPVTELTPPSSGTSASWHQLTSDWPRSASGTRTRPTRPWWRSSVQDGHRAWHDHFRTWRKRRLREVERQYGDRLDEVAEFLAEFAAKIKAVGPKTYLESMAHNERDAKREARAALEKLPPDRRS